VGVRAAEECCVAPRQSRQRRGRTHKPQAVADVLGVIEEAARKYEFLGRRRRLGGVSLRDALLQVPHGRRKVHLEPEVQAVERVADNNMGCHPAGAIACSGCCGLQANFHVATDATSDELSKLFKQCGSAVPRAQEVE